MIRLPWLVPDHGGRCREISRAGVARQTIELMVSLSVCVLLVRTFSAEAYVVPTGSMAPTLLGLHRELTCPNCRFVFVVGIDEDGHTGQAVCPNCGQSGLDKAPTIECGGDRVLVQKFLYEYQRPRRWEVAVFHFPGEPSQAYVKRVVGLPGESIRIDDGDIVVDGRIVRKSLAELRAMRILIHDSRFQPADAGRFPRWFFRPGAGYRSRGTGWLEQDGQFIHAEATPRATDEWLVYRHWDPSRGRYGPVRDFYSYNGSDVRAENEIKDLGLEARLSVGESVESLAVLIRSGADSFVVTIPVAKPGPIEVVRSGRRLPLAECYNPFEEKGCWPRPVTLEASVFDRRLMVAINGKPLFAPLDYEHPLMGPPPGDTPVALGVRGGVLTVSELRIYRDIYYTSSLIDTPRHPYGTMSPVRLGDDEFFVLGDNSPVSNDSRFWTEGPVVRGSMFVGKPFLVHLPGQVVPLQVFGRSFCWVPDPRRIRYIR
jgi:signal peptidase I